MPQKRNNSNINDLKLRNMHVRTSFGLQTNHEYFQNLYSLEEGVYITIHGKRICKVNINVKHDGHYYFPHQHWVSRMICINVSPCHNFIAASVVGTNEDNGLENGIGSVLIYSNDIDNGLHKRPKTLMLPNSSSSMRLDRIVTGVTFSHDSHILALFTNIASDGVYVYDWLLEQLVQQIPVNFGVTSVHFNLRNETRMAISGNDDAIEFWHYTKKTAHIAPIRGLPASEANYLCCLWLEYNVVLAGTDEGDLVLIHGVECKQVLEAFHPINDEDKDIFPSIVGIIHKPISNTIIVMSSDARIGIYSMESANNKYKSIHLELLSQWYIAGTETQPYRDVRNISWHNDNPDSMRIVVTFRSSVEVFEPVRLEIIGDPKVPQKLNSQQILLETHMSNISSGEIATRTTLFASMSIEDKQVNIWDMNEEMGSTIVTEVFHERGGELPYDISMHPSGRYVAFACDEDIKEYALLNGKLEHIQSIPTRVALRSTSSEPIVNIFPCSGVQYSNGGHMIAVWAGKYAMVFSKYELDYSHTVSGVSKRVMDITEHTGNISGLVWSSDDSKLYTCSLDGAVFMWTFGKFGRDSNCYQKGSCVCLSLSPLSSTLVVINEISDAPTSIQRKYSNRRGSIAGGGGSSSSLGSLNNVSSGNALVNSRGNIKYSRSSNGDSGLVKRKLAYWNNGVVTDPPSGVMTINLNISTLAFTSAQGPDDESPTEYCFIGLKDGSVLVFSLPIPVMVIQEQIETIAMTETLILQVPEGDGTANLTLMEDPEAIITDDIRDNIDSNNTITSRPRSSSAATTTNVPTATTTTTELTLFDDKKCRKFALHAGEVTCIATAKSGKWVLTMGVDGAIFCLSTTKYERKFDLVESFSPECEVVMTDKDQLSGMLTKISDLESKLLDSKHSNEREVSAVMDRCERNIKEIQAKLDREIKRRDDIIIREREVNLKKIKELHDEVNQAKSDGSTQIQQLENMYEKKLASESLYLSRMRQAYDEYVVHSRMDLDDAAVEAERKAHAMNAKHNAELEESERQKKMVLMYVDYVDKRYAEVINQLEDAHDVEKFELKYAVDVAKGEVDKASKRSQSDVEMLKRKYQEANMIVEQKEQELIKTKGSADWESERSARLEDALDSATKEIQRLNDDVTRWETRAGEKQQEAAELELVRQMLTSQLHVLRQELGPKDKAIAKSDEKLREMESEYDVNMQALSAKDRDLSTTSNRVHLLTKQVRELRLGMTRRDAALKRSYKVLKEYQDALKNAIFNRSKTTITHKYVPDVGKSLIKAIVAETVNEKINANSNNNNSSNNSSGNESNGSSNENNVTTVATTDTTVNMNVSNNNNNANTNTNTAPILDSDYRNIETNLVKVMKSIGGQMTKKDQSEIVEIMVRNRAMERSLDTLNKVLEPYANERGGLEDEIDEVFNVALEEEQHRQLTQMRRSMVGLQKNIQSSAAASTNRKKMDVAVNRKLLEEMNELRLELGATRRERNRASSERDMALRKARKIREALKSNRSYNGNISFTSNNDSNSTQMNNPNAIVQTSKYKRGMIYGEDDEASAVSDMSSQQYALQSYQDTREQIELNEGSQVRVIEPDDSISIHSKTEEVVKIPVQSTPNMHNTNNLTSNVDKNKNIKNDRKSNNKNQNKKNNTNSTSSMSKIDALMSENLNDIRTKPGKTTKSRQNRHKTHLAPAVTQLTSDRGNIDNINNKGDAAIVKPSTPERLLHEFQDIVGGTNNDISDLNENQGNNSLGSHDTVGLRQTLKDFHTHPDMNLTEMERIENIIGAVKTDKKQIIEESLNQEEKRKMKITLSRKKAYDQVKALGKNISKSPERSSNSNDHGQIDDHLNGNNNGSDSTEEARGGGWLSGMASSINKTNHMSNASRSSKGMYQSKSTPMLRPTTLNENDVSLTPQVKFPPVVHRRAAESDTKKKKIVTNGGK